MPEGSGEVQPSQAGQEVEAVGGRVLADLPLWGVWGCPGLGPLLSSLSCSVGGENLAQHSPV